MTLWRWHDTSFLIDGHYALIERMLIQVFIPTCTRFGLWISNLALVLKEVVARGPANRTEFWTVKFSESMICDISSTFTNGSVPLESNGYKPEKDVYLQNHSYL